MILVVPSCKNSGSEPAYDCTFLYGNGNGNDSQHLGAGFLHRMGLK